MGGDLLFQRDALLMMMKDGWGGGALCDTDANKRGRDLHNIHHHTCHLNAHQYHNSNQLNEGLFIILNSSLKHQCIGVCVCVVGAAKMVSKSVPNFQALVCVP